MSEVTDRVIHFKGSLAVEGDLAKLDHHQLKDYLAQAVILELDTEGQGQLSDDIDVTGIGIDWESLEV